MTINELTGIVVDLSIKIHSKIGPGCFEKVYEDILCYELNRAGLQVKQQMLFPVEYESLLIPNAYKLDLLVEDKLIIELKTVYPLPAVYFKQTRTYLSLLNLKHVMLLNFKVERMKDGIHRVFNNFGRESLTP